MNIHNLIDALEDLEGFDQEVAEATDADNLARRISETVEETESTLDRGDN